MPHSNQQRTGRRVLGALAAAAVVLGVSGTSASADPTRTPAAVVSADGRSATDGVRTLTVSQSQGLAAGGQQVRVTGSGYDVNKGVYVALCVIPPANALPTPCGGGVDTEGQAGASQWVSSNPPSYGAGLARPYGPGGSFDTTFTVNPMINATVDCRFVRCGILTRNDHTRTADRSQDIIVPVTFAQPSTPGAPPPVGAPPAGAPGAPSAPAPTPPPAAPPTAPPTTAATTTTTTTPPAPETTVSDDGDEVTDGARTLRVVGADELDERGDTVTVEGSGFDSSRGVYLSLCAAGDDPEQPPAPCAAGEGRSVWVSNDPPEWGVELARPYEEGGSFRFELDVEPVIDESTDCTQVECAITVRADDTAPADRSLDLALPISFVETAEVEVTETTTEAERDDDTAEEALAAAVDEPSSGGAMPLIVAALVVGAVVASGLGLWFRRRRNHEPSDDGPTVGVV